MELSILSTEQFSQTSPLLVELEGDVGDGTSTFLIVEFNQIVFINVVI